MTVVADVILAEINVLWRESSMTRCIALPETTTLHFHQQFVLLGLRHGYSVLKEYLSAGSWILYDHHCLRTWYICHGRGFHLARH